MQQVSQCVGAGDDSATAPRAFTWKMINDDIQLLPNFTTENVIQYLTYQKEADGLEKQDWKSLNYGGYKLFKEGHVQKIFVRSADIFVKAVCLPEMRKDRTYSLEITISKYNMNFSGAVCSCPAGKGLYGSCKHLAALCFALEDFVKV